MIKKHLKGKEWGELYTVCWSNGHSGGFSEALDLVELGQVPERSLDNYSVVFDPDMSVWCFVLCTRAFCFDIVIHQRHSGSGSLWYISLEMSFFIFLCPMVEVAESNLESRKNRLSLNSGDSQNKKKVYNHTRASLSPDFTDRNDFTNIWPWSLWNFSPGSFPISPKAKEWDVYIIFIFYYIYFIIFIVSIWNDELYSSIHEHCFYSSELFITFQDSKSYFNERRAAASCLAC